MRCSKSVKLGGGFTAVVRRARKGYTCFYCRRGIVPGEYYVIVEGVRGSLVERYHVRCFNQVMPHRLLVSSVAGELRLCEVGEFAEG